MTSSPATPQWRKSSYSNGAGGECVEVADLAGITAVRDSKVPAGPRIAIRHAAWAGFVGALRTSRLS
ncbi:MULTISPECIES: DUF397 domain-containing protein [unclassified Streptomyces]|uniref:DUF397 domain-containing protein n=1 Tax=unclassified Streptomyces TaxID=2593676 RepID=UPI00365B2129